tara:strand:+ start:7987 stop:8382 length:396 start_codon:yes stop_codon:yes gene_type:complete
MALQSSGSISISQIKAEVGGSSSSLRTLSAAAGKSAPDGMQEFYGFSALEAFSSSTGYSIGDVCDSGSINQTYHHDGSGTYPAAGDTVYSDNGGTTVLGDNFYKFNTTWVYRITGGAGVVNASWPQEICDE